MKQTTKSLVKTRQDNTLALKAAIMDFLGWSEMEFAKFQEAMGLQYLKSYLQDEYSINLLSKSKVFWAWWRNHWALRDETFLDTLTTGEFNLSPQLKLRLYKELHDGATLAGDIHPNSVVLSESYMVMVDEFINMEREEVQHG